MAANDTLGLNQVFQIYHEDESAYEGLVMHKSATDSVVMSLGDSISGDAYWPDNELELSMHEYITYNGVNYVLVNPPTIVREGMVADNSELKGMTKYSFKFYHPMYQLGNLPFSDVAVTNDQKKYLSENKTFSWIGTANDFLAKLNKNLEDTQWKVEMSSRFPEAKKTEMSDVIAFDKNTVADALKVAYDTWGVPYVVDVIKSGQAGYSSGKRFKVVWGLPSNEIYENASKKQQNIPYVFQMGKGVGLKNNSRTPRNNKIITRIAGYGSENNIPYGYPQIVWTGNQSWDYTINNNPSATNSYPIYDGIVGGQKVRLIKHPFTRTHLMPNVYVDAVNKKVNPNATGYDPDTELKDYYDATEADDYPNPINLQAPSYDIHEFEDIKPELGNETIVGVTPLNPDLTPASGWDDTMDDDGNYLQSYFEITLPTLSFDIYACAAITEAMQINMRSGACLGCTFPVEVDWEDYKANFYNEDGEFDPVIHTQEDDGHVRNGKKYPNSTTTSVKLILKKEIETFGTLMPNVYQHPASGDQFVVLGISLPTSYITNAQTRLDNAMKSYMLENNVYYYDYPLKFDEAFLRNNTYILEQLKPNAIVRFEFAGQQLQLFVKQMNVKFGDGVLPKYDITLTDNVDVVLNQIGQVSDDVEKLATLISLLRQSYGNNALVELAKKLSKVEDDTAQGFIRFVKGLQVGERFDSGLLGEGGVFRKDADGTTYIEADKLYIRMRAYFDSVEIRRYMHSGGNRVATPAGVKCVRVDNIAKYNDEFIVVDENGTYWEEDINGDKHVVASGLTIIRYRCYFRAKDNDGNEVTNDFVIGDQAYCHITNGGTYSLQMHHYWRLVVGCSTYGTMTEDGEHWIDLANYFDANNQPAMLYWTNTRGEQVSHKSHQAGSDIPVAQDDIVQLGNADDTYRQGAIIEYSSGEDSPSYKIYQNIDDFSFEDTNFIALGYNSQTGHAYLNVYGDAYIGDPDGSTFIKYEQEDSQTHQPKMTIKAVVEFQNPDDPTQTTTLDDFASAVVGDIENLQSQIDGEIDTWFYAGIPTLQNAPANEWTTDAEKEKHTGDLYYDIGTGADAGKAYRFIRSQTTPYVYSWQYIDDTAITEALRIAAHAQDTADGKRRVFTAQPYPPYDVGDLWSNAIYPANNTEKDAENDKYYKDLLTCKTAKAEGGSFSISDWGLTTNYTDDTALTNFVSNTYAPFVTNIQGQVDKKAETWYQDDDPSTLTREQGGWYGEDDADHVGDIWFCTINNPDPSPYKKGTTWIWQSHTNQQGVVSYAWEEQTVPDDVFDKIDGKAEIYVTKPTTYNERDLWIVEQSSATCPDSDIPANCQRGDIVVSSASRVNNYQKGDWTKKDRYTDDSKFNGYINQILNGTGASGDSKTVADAIRVIKGALNDATVIDGGLVLTTLINLRSNNKTWAGISGVYDEKEESQGGAKGHGIAAWYGGGMADWELYKSTHPSATINDTYAKSLFRFDGSGYVASGNVTWDKNGAVTIKNITTLSDYQNTNLLNELATFNNAFSFSTSGSGGTTVLSITPNVPFTSLSILDTSVSPNVGRPVATQKWVNDNYISIAFFNRLFQAYSSTTISDANKVDANDTTTTINNLKLLVGTWTNEYLSSLGYNPQQGGGGVGDVTWSALATSVSVGVQQIHISHLASAGVALTADVTKNLTIKQEGKSDIVYNGTEAKEITIGSGVGDRLQQYTLNDRASLASFTHATDLIYTAKGGNNGCIDKPDNVDAFGLISFKTAVGYYGQMLMPAGVGRLYLRSSNSLNGGWSEVALTSDLTSYAKKTDIKKLTVKAGAETQGFEYSPIGSADATLTFKAADNSGISVARSSGTITIGLDASTITAGKATQLASNVTLWGNTFNGTQSIGYSDTSEHTASLSHVQDITMSGNVKMNRGQFIQMYVNDGYRNILGTDSVNNILSLGYRTAEQGFDTRIFGTDVRLWYYNATDNWNEGVTLTSVGRLGIGTTNPQYKLDVNGTAYVSSDITAGSDILMENNKFIRIKNAPAQGATAEYVNMIGLDSSNRFSVFYGALRKQYTTGIYGYDVNIGHGNDSGHDGAKYFTVFRNTGHVTINAYDDTDATRNVFLNVGGSTKTNRLYLSDSIYLVVENNGVHVVGGGLYADTFISALGSGSASGGIVLSPLLDSLNTSGINPAGQSNKVLVYNNGSWSFQNYVSGSSGTVTAVKVGTTTYNPTNGVVTLPDYLPLTGGTLTGQLTVKANLYQPLCVNSTHASTNATCIQFGHTKNDVYTDYGGILMDSANGYLKRYTAGVLNSYTILDSGNSSVSKSGDTLTVTINGTTQSLTNTWRGIQDNLTSTSTVESLSANQGKILYGYITTLQGYFDNGVAKSAAKLTTTSKKLWGNTYWTSGGVPTEIGTSSSNASLNYVLDITMSGNIYMSVDKYIYTKISGSNRGLLGTWSGYTAAWLGYYTAHDSGYDMLIYGKNIKLYYGTSATQGFVLNNNGNVGIGTSSPEEKLHVNGNIMAGSGSGTFIKIGGLYLVYDSDNNAIKVSASATGNGAANLYATGAVSALGAGSGSSGIVLNEPLSTINSSGLSSPTVNGATLVWTGSTWLYSYQAKVTVHSLETISGGITSYTTLNVRGTSKFTGNVGIAANASDTYQLYVNGDIYGSRLYFPNGSYLYTATGPNNLKFFYIEATYAYVNGNVIQTSDMRKKDVVSDLNISLESIANAPIFKFKWNDKRDYVTHVGTSAQYWDSVLPDCVIRTPDGTLGLDENAISLASVILTTRKVVDHERRIKLLEVENEALRKEIEQLKKAA